MHFSDLIEAIDFAAGIAIYKLIEHLCLKIIKKIDAQNITFLDVEEPE